MGYGVEKGETKADVRRGRGIRIAGPYVHMSMYLPSDMSTCILHPCWYNTGSQQHKHQEEEKEKEKKNLLSSLPNQSWRSLLERLPRTLLFLLQCHNTERKQLETLCNQIW